MKLVYHKETKSYLIMDEAAVARIESETRSGVFFENKLEIILDFCKYNSTWYDGYTDVESECTFICEFVDKADLRDQYAEYLI